jgi:hypothetical protein
MMNPVKRSHNEGQITKCGIKRRKSTVCGPGRVGVKKRRESREVRAIFGFREIIASSFPHKKVEPLSNDCPTTNGGVARHEAGENQQYRVE